VKIHFDRFGGQNGQSEKYFHFLPNRSKWKFTSTNLEAKSVEVKKLYSASSVYVDTRQRSSRQRSSRFWLQRSWTSVSKDYL
jgi:hypothetical protein